MTGERHAVAFTLNGKPLERTVDGRLLLSDFLRHDLEFTGTHVGCEHGVCGSCTVLVDGNPARSCLMLAVQADGHAIETVEGLAAEAAPLSPLQAAFRKHHALQCGYCTPGFLMSATALLRTTAHPTRLEIREALSGNLCRCTGYSGIVDAVDEVANGEAETHAV
jgi:aerobic-type carbon monoxide dehydrogenase small subunit (CoxS/CutS family)